MINPKILVTAATGNTGFPAVLELLERKFPVRAFVRRENDRSRTLQNMGAEIFVGSLDDISDVRRALTGVQRAYFCPPILPGLLDKATIFAAAAEEMSLEFVVSLSQWLADPSHPSIHTRQHWLADNVFRQIPHVENTFVTPGWFADNYLAAPDLITQFGLFPMPLGDGLNAPPSNEDIARVVAAVLADPAPHIGQSYRPTGPTLLSPQKIAEALGNAVGRKVKYVDVPLSMFGKIGRSLGLPDYTTGQVLHYLADYQLNAFGHGAPTSVVEEIGGRPAEDFETIARRYLASGARRTLGSRISATYRLSRGILRGIPNLAVIARTEDYRIPHSALSADSADWLASHESVATANL